MGEILEAIREWSDGAPDACKLKADELTPAEDDEASTLIGRSVLLTRLSNRMLNNLHGIVVSFDRVTKQYGVLLDSGRSVSVLEKNLDLPDPPHLAYFAE